LGSRSPILPAAREATVEEGWRARFKTQEFAMCGRPRWLLPTIVLIGLHSLSSLAYAQDEEARSSTSASGSPWVVQLSPYVWTSALEGDVSPFKRAPTIHIEKSIGEVLEDFQGGLFAQVLLQKGRVVIVGDLMYVTLSDAKVVNELPIVGPIPALSAALDTTQFTSTLLAGYRVVTGARGSLDLLGGARIWHLSNEVNVSFLSGPRPSTRASDGETRSSVPVRSCDSTTECRS
jgi:hypothetical protein